MQDIRQLKKQSERNSGGFEVESGFHFGLA